MIASAPTSSRTDTRATPTAGLIEGLRVAYSVTAATATRDTTSAQASTKPMSSAPSSQRPSRPGRPMSGIQRTPPMTTAQATGIETAGLLESQRDVAPRASRAASPASTTSAASKIGRISSGAASTSIPASRMVRCFVYPFSTDDHQAHQDTGDLPQPEPGARLRDSLRLPGVHLPLPEDRPAGLRGDPRRLRPRRSVRRAQILEALPLVVPERRRLPRGGDQPDPG